MIKSALKWTAALTMAATLYATGALAARTDLTLGVRLEPPHLDPTAGAAAAIDEITYANIFEGLTRIDETGTVQPGLAKSWSISKDGLTYTFSLQDGVTFHDGSSFDAQDVVFSLDRARGEDSVNAQKALFEPIESVTAIDPMTVEMKLKRPTGAMLFNLAGAMPRWWRPRPPRPTRPIRLAPVRSNLPNGPRVIPSPSRRIPITGNTCQAG